MPNYPSLATNVPACLGSDPAVAELYAGLLGALAAVGAVTAEPKKTCVHLVNRTGFAGVHPRRGHLNLEIKSSSPIDSPRVAKCEQVSAHRFHNTVPLRAAAEVDAELLGWLRDAYQLST
ncbi:MAG TPA: DUF5655 domain-containing protein [Longimicrobiaceae bacterium]|nr:DUF5655 domain-containing protein [Longimicrobiaceae bacterium]